MLRPTLPSGIRRLFSLPLTRARLLHDADEEVRFHLEMWKAEFIAQGMSEANAEAEAHRRFGDTNEFHDYASRRAVRKARWHRAVDWLVDWQQDLHFALRQIRKAPLFSTIAVFTLALGIGANTAIFSVVHRLLVAPLPYPNGDRIVALKTIGRVGSFVGLASISASDPYDPPTDIARAWRTRARSFDAIAGAQQVFMALRGDNSQDTVTYAFITANVLPMLGARPAFGRNFRTEEERSSNDRVAMISYRWWQRAYGGRDDVLGQILEYEGTKYTVVGVMPNNFVIPMLARQLDWLSHPTSDVWLPASIDSVDMLFGRLKPGVNATDATRELQAIANATPLTSRRNTGAGADIRARAMRPQDFLGAKEILTIEVLFAAVGALLLIACANVSNLMLVRAWSRRREFAIRMGLGAGRARLVRLALTESTLIALLAGALGTLIAWQGVRIIVALRPIALDSLAGAHVDPVVLAWTAGVSVLTGILFGAASAIFVGTRTFGALLRGETDASTGGVFTKRVRSTLIVAEIALSLMLLVGAGLLARSFAALQATPLGFDPHNLVSIDLLVPPILSRSGQGGVIADAVERQLSLVPGVTDAALGTLPTAGFNLPHKLIADADGGEREVGISEFLTTVISPAYFATSRITLVAGRAPRAVSPDSGSSASPFLALSNEIVVSRSLANRIAPNGQALGMRIRQIDARPPPGLEAPPTWSTIVGIANDVQLPGPRSDLQENQLYTLPGPRTPLGTFVVRFAGTVPRDAESVLRQTIQRVNPKLVARRARLGDDYLRESLAPTRFTLALLGVFAVVALTLSVVGLAGSISYNVSQRTREIGIRIALGASMTSVTTLVVADGLVLAAIGLALGLAAAAFASRMLASLLYAVTPLDLTTFVVIGVCVGATALVASVLPARRVSRIDPVEALRAD